MLTKSDIIPIQLTLTQVQIARSEAEALFSARVAAGGVAAGVSRIRREDRGAKAFQDGFTGQLGNLALSLYWYGSEEQYLTSRKLANANPLVGDGGSDLPGWAIDIKTSRLLLGKRIADYNLVVRPREFHQGVVYVLALVPEFDDSLVYLCGWVRAEDLSARGGKDERFGDAIVLPVPQLNPLLPRVVNVA